MFNLLIQKTKRIIEMKIFENEVISNKNTIPKYYLDMETDDVELKGTIYGEATTFIFCIIILDTKLIIPIFKLYL